MPAQVATPHPALKRGVHVMKRPEAQVAKKPLASMRFVPVETKPPALKRGQHVCKCPEHTTALDCDPLASEHLTDASVLGFSTGSYVYVVMLFNSFRHTDILSVTVSVGRVSVTY